jgi:group I intron endonuclease
MIIYKTTNLINNRFYVGKDKMNNPRYLGSGKILKEAIKKYGKENFIKEILEICETVDKMNEREIFWIEELNAIEEGYNITKGGDGGNTIENHPNKNEISKKHSEWMIENNPTRGRKKSQEEIDNWRKSYVGKYTGSNNPNYGSKRNESTKIKISESKKKYWENLSEKDLNNFREKISETNKGKKGKKQTDEQKIKHSKYMKENNPMKGKTHTEEVKKLLSELNKKPKKEETKIKISESLKEYHRISEKPKNTRIISINGEIYKGYKEASLVLNLPIGTIRNRIKSKSFEDYFYMD